MVSLERDAERRDLDGRKRAAAGNRLGLHDGTDARRFDDRLGPLLQLVLGGRHHRPERNRCVITIEIGDGEILQCAHDESAWS